LPALLRQDHHHVQKSDENNGNEESAAERARAAARLQQRETVYMHWMLVPALKSQSPRSSMGSGAFGPLRWIAG